MSYSDTCACERCGCDVTILEVVEENASLLGPDPDEVPDSVLLPACDVNDLLCPDADEVPATRVRQAEGPAPEGGDAPATAVTAARLPMLQVGPEPGLVGLSLQEGLANGFQVAYCTAKFSGGTATPATCGRWFLTRKPDELQYTYKPVCDACFCDCSTLETILTHAIERDYPVTPKRRRTRRD